MSAGQPARTRFGDRLWTTEEDECLRDHYGLIPASDLAVRLDRSRRAVYNRAFLLGIHLATVVERRDRRDQCTIRRLRILIAYRMGVLTEPEAAIAAGIAPGRLIVECGKEAARGMAEATTGRDGDGFG